VKGLTGKRALVTDGDSNLGQAIALRLAEAGVDVALSHTCQTPTQVRAAPNAAPLVSAAAGSGPEPVDGRPPSTRT
jgi:NAD(P)-dependent dehydrogenase (short-subunit alcohol dehydrogenase family)